MFDDLGSRITEDYSEQIEAFRRFLVDFKKYQEDLVEYKKRYEEIPRQEYDPFGSFGRPYLYK